MCERGREHKRDGNGDPPLRVFTCANQTRMSSSGKWVLVSFAALMRCDKSPPAAYSRTMLRREPDTKKLM